MAGPQSAPPELPGFTHDGWLGSGGFADVFSYIQDDLDREVAVKVLLDDLPEQAATLFASEINLMAKLSSHPSIVSVFQAGVAADGRPFLVMESCPPPTLRGRLRREPYDVPKTLEIGIQIASAVETAHRLGVVHRDIKPSNILFTEYGRAALTDFGISVPATSAPGAQTAYSVAWAPPEQIRNEPVGPSADIYSLGATLWAMLAGHSPFESTSAEQTNSYEAIQERNLHAEVPALGRGDVPESLERTLRTALDKDPGKRQASALDFARELQRVQNELNLPRTTIDVRVDAAARRKAAEAERAYEGTRVASFERSSSNGEAAQPVTPPQNGSAKPGTTAPADGAGRSTSTGGAQFWLPLSQSNQPSWWRESSMTATKPAVTRPAGWPAPGTNPAYPIRATNPGPTMRTPARPMPMQGAANPWPAGAAVPPQQQLVNNQHHSAQPVVNQPPTPSVPLRLDPSQRTGGVSPWAMTLLITAAVFVVVLIILFAVM